MARRSFLRCMAGQLLLVACSDEVPLIRAKHCRVAYEHDAAGKAGSANSANAAHSGTIRH
ncbi:MAG TPA: hypothetical protein VGV86_13290 [Acidimicrobiales bacterium]|nr:hypothetical protein [Acidimicrobiales bacterium]